MKDSTLLAYRFNWCDSPLGRLFLVVSDSALHALLWENDIKAQEAWLSVATKAPEDALLLKTKKELQEYFEGNRLEFDIPLSPFGTTFQKMAWDALRRIPYGQRISYKEQATSMGDPKKARAVGVANGKNPISIIVPCHRVVGSNGALTGFAGGLTSKKYLLDLEKQALCNPPKTRFNPTIFRNQPNSSAPLYG